MAKDSNSILNPITESSFFSTYFEKKILYIPRNQSNYFDSILSFEDIDNFIASGELNYPTVLLHDLEAETEFQPWNFKLNKISGIPIDRELMYKQIADGKTLVLNSMHSKIPKLNHFISDISRKWNVKLLGNVYLTPAKKQGLDWHFDKHDVFILQIKGEKMWEVIDEHPTLRDKKTEYDKQESINLSSIRRILLKEGDTLYLPRGIYHRATSENEFSCHLTLGLYTLKINSVFESFLKDSFQQPELRKSIIKSTESIDYKNTLGEIKEYALNYFNSLTESDLVNNWRKELEKFPISDNKGRLNKVLSKLSLNSETEVCVNSEMHYKLKEKNSFIVIELDKKELKYPIIIKSFLETILSINPIKIGNSSGDLPLHNKIQLVEKFINEGLLLTVD